ncbi:MAG: tetratricopeptide repeat protein [Gammaproteobacteria bacterium]|nr:tetratricopeptide repeat protein [Gammaproteobacteria bacterium]MCY4219559.1 tetratricopeptide repeat protein [Gammaproteobacteria bacterium]MCY4274628.1 tetratricopeptide repeat protein [Gammaproteobacteria bacterium]
MFEDPPHENSESAIELASGIASFEAKNFSQAMRLLGPLAENGVGEAQYRLAVMHQRGLGVVRNELMAYRWMKAAAQQGIALAEHGLGCMYLDGDCVIQDINTAKTWLSKAADNGLEGSRMLLDMITNENL